MHGLDLLVEAGRVLQYFHFFVLVFMCSLIITYPPLRDGLELYNRSSWHKKKMLSTDFSSVFHIKKLSILVSNTVLQRAGLEYYGDTSGLHYVLERIRQQGVSNGLITNALISHDVVSHLDSSHIGR